MLVLNSRYFISCANHVSKLGWLLREAEAAIVRERDRNYMLEVETNELGQICRTVRFPFQLVLYLPSKSVDHQNNYALGINY
jgi:hypothetical protein